MNELLINLASSSTFDRPSSVPCIYLEGHYKSDVRLIFTKPNDGTGYCIYLSDELAYMPLAKFLTLYGLGLIRQDPSAFENIPELIEVIKEIANEAN